MPPVDMLGFFLDLYDECQRNYPAVDRAIRAANPSALARLAAYASREIRALYGGRADLNRSEDTSTLVNRWVTSHGALGSYHLLAGLDRLLADVRLEVQERAIATLETGHKAVIPNSPFKLEALGALYLASRTPENICSYLHEFRVAVLPERARVEYVPIGWDAPASLRWRWGTLNEALVASQGDEPFLRVFCANFSENASDFMIRARRATPGWEQLGFGTTFWFQSVNRAALDSLKEELRAILRQCTEIQAQVLVLPELTMPKELVSELEDHCRQSPFPILTVAGSWHVKDRLNRTPVYAGPRRIAEYDKLYRFTMIPSEVHEFVSHVRVKGKVDRKRNASEEIDVGEKILIIDTDVGRFAIAICIDALMADLIHAYESIGVTHLFIPARSKTVNRFTTSLRTFCENRTAFVCFSNTPSAVAPRETSSFVLVPTRPSRFIAAGRQPPNGRSLRPCEERHAVLEPRDF